MGQIITRIVTNPIVKDVFKAALVTAASEVVRQAGELLKQHGQGNAQTSA